ncbi:MAG: hypothetical protein HY696_10630 [Deltaproteobacteria bacterium]|nr:hypothetical protein [Betaproteobacteria bacterium]MBI4238849.1 hypothetical protein [Deltaproteobacteria bacterium]
MNWERFVQICRLFNAHQVRYVLVGGFAIILHGYERTTGDIDFLVDPAEANIRAIQVALRPLVPDIDELRPTDVRGYTVVRIGGADFVIDLIHAIGAVDYDAVAQAIDQVEIADDVLIPVANLETMIQLKQGLRGKDHDDLLFLEGKQRFLTQQKKS